MMNASPNTRAKYVFGDIVAPSAKKAERVTTELQTQTPLPVLEPVIEDSLCYSPSPSKQFVKNQVKDKRIAFRDTTNLISEANQCNEDRASARKDLINKTELAISAADKSVNESLNAVRKAKENSIYSKQKEISRVKEMRRLQYEEAVSLNNETEKHRREMLEMRAALSSQIQKERALQNQEKKRNDLDKIMKESEFKSAVYRSHKQQLQEDEKRRRRESTDKRAKLRHNHRMGEERMKLSRIAEENAHIQEGYERSLATRSYKQTYANQRRNSFAFRTGDAIRIRKLYEKIEVEKKHFNHKSYELKRMGDKDADAYHRQCQEDRRNSFAFRGEEARRRKQISDEIESDNQTSQHDSYDLKRMGEKDAEAYHRQCEEDRRNSFAFRGEEARRRKQISDEIESDKQTLDHESDRKSVV